MTLFPSHGPTSPTRSFRKGRKRFYWALAGLAAVGAIAGAAAGPLSSRVEQSAYRVLESHGSIELRAYDPSIAAEAMRQGERGAALGEGFSLIAAYIFGANATSAKIAMTAPVEQQSLQNDPAGQRRDGGAWTVRFIMPRGWRMETLPSPGDPRVTLKPIEARTMLAIRFSGMASVSSIRSKTEELRSYAAARRIETAGEPVLAFYNPPWTLPFLRRNEIMLRVKQA